MFSIGDKVWLASFESEQKTAVCPECFGKKYLTVILGDDSQVTIDCAGCSGGYDTPRGYVWYYEPTAKVAEIVIDGMDVSADNVDYKFIQTGHDVDHFTIKYYSRTKSENVFATKEEAENRAKDLAAEYKEEQLENINNRKKYDERKWSWHVHHYRAEIRRAEETIERSKQLLDVAKENAKTE